jgi:hypothetical protein
MSAFRGLYLLVDDKSSGAGFSLIPDSFMSYVLLTVVGRFMISKCLNAPLVVPVSPPVATVSNTPSPPVTSEFPVASHTVAAMQIGLGEF